MSASEEIINLQDCMFRAVDFIQTFLPDMRDSTRLVELTNPQIDAIDSIQFGFPLRNYTFSEVRITPRGVVMIWPRQTGKSYACAYASVAFVFMMKNCHIGIISASEDASRKLMRKIKEIIRDSPFADQIVKRYERLDYVELLNGNTIECWPCTENIRGSTYTFLFCDEAAIIDEDILFDAALPTTTHGLRWIMLSTPAGPKGKFIEYYYKALETRPIICKKCGTEYPQEAFTNDDFPLDRLPEPMMDCVECGANDWKYGVGQFSVPWVDPWNDGVRDPVEVKRILDENDWSPHAQQEYLGKIIDEASMVFLGEWVDKCTNPDLKNAKRFNRNHDYVIGVDYGRKHDASAFYVTHQNPNSGQITLDYGMSIAGEYDADKTYYAIRQDLMKIIEFFNPMWVVPDATGLGDPLVEDLENDIEELKKRLWREKGVRLRTQVYHNKDERPNDRGTSNSKGFIFSRTTKPPLIGELIKSFAKQKILIPPKTEPEIGELRKELLRFECEYKPGTNYITYGTQSYHDDRVIALALSVWGHRRKPWTTYKVEPMGGNYDFEDDRNYESYGLY